MNTANVENKDLPAFACVGYDALGGGYQQDGLTKREYFAALAMQGILANAIVRDILSGNNGMQVPELIAEYSVQYADAVLAKL
jgi:hypothetical protein